MCTKFVESLLHQRKDVPNGMSIYATWRDDDVGSRGFQYFLTGALIALKR